MTSRQIAIVTLAPPQAGPCVKQTVKATIVAKNGDRYVGTNHCMTPQPTCARAGLPTGVGYHLCKEVCSQPAHAEVNALAIAGKHARGARLYLEGHSYACAPCIEAANAAGITLIVIGPPPSRREALEECLTELLRLYDWRNELGRQEKEKSVEQITMRNHLLRYGRQKKAAWERARQLVGKRTLSDFIRNAPEEEKREVYGRVMEQATLAQRHQLGCFNDQPAAVDCQVCGGTFRGDEI